MSDMSGMYKIDFTYLRSLNISITDINSIRIFGNGGLVIPDNNTGIIPDSLMEIPRLVVRKNGSIPDTGDYIVFYGRGVRGWQYNGGNKFQHYINPYTVKNCYFFTVSQYPAKQMDSIISPNLTLTSVPYYQEKIFIEPELTNLLNSGRRWFGQQFTQTSPSYTYNNSLPGIVSNTLINYAFNFIHRSDATATDYLNIFESGNSILQQMPMGATGLGDGQTSPYAYDFPVNATGKLPSNDTTTSAITVQVVAADQNSQTWFDWLEIYYQRKFEALNDALLFTTSDATGTFQYTINNLSSEVRAFDVTDHSNVKQIKFNQTGSLCTFQLQQIAGSVREIAVIGKNGYLTPSLATKIDKFTPNNLHDFQDQIDFIIISSAEFISSANKLMAYRQTHDSLNTIVVDIQQIFNEFSGGLPDPLSIREFLKYTQSNWIDPKPRYVLLFGDGYFDYKNIITSQRNWIPPWETYNSFETIDSYPSDDQFVMLGSSNTYSMAIGRLPVRNGDDAATIVDKLISYDSAPLDPWRNRITFVSDDGKTTDPITPDDGSEFTDESEAIAESSILQTFEKNKIYEVAYTTVLSGGGRRKPDVNAAIDAAFNSGTIIINWIGHGNDDLWAHEAVFTREGDLPLLVNKDRLAFSITATCEYGWYDNPNPPPSAGERLVTMGQGGSIADFSPARATLDAYSFPLDQSLFNSLLQRNSSGQFPRIGDACLLAKSSNPNSNTQKYHLFGDPTVRLLLPEGTAAIDSINGFSMAMNDTIKIKSLGHARVVGTIKQNNSVMPSFNGEGTLQLFDAEQQMSIMDGTDSSIDIFRFKLPGSVLYRGDVSVTNGHFNAVFPIPKDVTFGNNDRLAFYAWSGQSDGTGSTRKIL